MYRRRQTDPRHAENTRRLTRLIRPSVCLSAGNNWIKGPQERRKIAIKKTTQPSSVGLRERGGGGGEKPHHGYDKDILLGQLDAETYICS